MIQPNELRIKNIVKNPRYFKEWGQHLYQTVECICGKDISTNKDDWDADYLEPVELTPDILEAIGWYWNNEADCYEHSDVRMSMNHNSISGWTMFNYVLKAKITNKIFYLHQLQNLYFALTGEELQIDITKLNKEK